ncbi:79_t:CDS:10, partial [Funneliformis geosporum]
MLLITQEQLDNLLFEGVDARICLPMKNQLEQHKKTLESKLNAVEIDSLRMAKTEKPIQRKIKKLKEERLNEVKEEIAINECIAKSFRDYDEDNSLEENMRKRGRDKQERAEEIEKALEKVGSSEELANKIPVARPSLTDPFPGEKVPIADYKKFRESIFNEAQEVKKCLSNPHNKQKYDFYLYERVGNMTTNEFFIPNKEDLKEFEKFREVVVNEELIQKFTDLFHNELQAKKISQTEINEYCQRLYGEDAKSFEEEMKDSEQQFNRTGIPEDIENRLTDKKYLGTKPTLTKEELDNFPEENLHDQVLQETRKKFFELTTDKGNKITDFKEGKEYREEFKNYLSSISASDNYEVKVIESLEEEETTKDNDFAHDETPISEVEKKLFIDFCNELVFKMSPTLPKVPSILMRIKRDKGLELDYQQELKSAKNKGAAEIIRVNLIREICGKIGGEGGSDNEKVKKIKDINRSLAGKLIQEIEQELGIKFVNLPKEKQQLLTRLSGSRELSQVDFSRELARRKREILSSNDIDKKAVIRAKIDEEEIKRECDNRKKLIDEEKIAENAEKERLAREREAVETAEREKQEKIERETREIKYSELLAEVKNATTIEAVNNLNEKINNFNYDDLGAKNLSALQKVQKQRKNSLLTEDTEDKINKKRDDLITLIQAAKNVEKKIAALTSSLTIRDRRQAGLKLLQVAAVDKNDFSTFNAIKKIGGKSRSLIALIDEKKKVETTVIEQTIDSINKHWSDNADSSSDIGKIEERQKQLTGLIDTEKEQRKTIKEERIASKLTIPEIDAERKTLLDLMVENKRIERIKEKAIEENWRDEFIDKIENFKKKKNNTLRKKSNQEKELGNFSKDVEEWFNELITLFANNTADEKKSDFLKEICGKVIVSDHAIEKKLRKEKSKLTDIDEEKLKKISQYLQEIVNNSKEEISLKIQTICRDQIKNDIETESNLNLLVDDGEWDKKIQALQDDLLPTDKQKALLTTRRQSCHNQLLKKEKKKKEGISSLLDKVKKFASHLEELPQEEINDMLELFTEKIGEVSVDSSAKEKSKSKDEREEIGEAIAELITGIKKVETSINIFKKAADEYLKAENEPKEKYQDIYSEAEKSKTSQAVSQCMKRLISRIYQSTELQPPNKEKYSPILIIGTILGLFAISVL